MSAWLVLPSACVMDTVVYAPRAKGAEAGRAGEDAQAGSAAGAAGSGEPTIYGCRAAGDDGPEAIFVRIVNMAADAGDWLRTDQTCGRDGDCRRALLTPACNLESGRCEACPAAVDRAVYSSRLIRCLANAIARCCSDPEASRDCVFRDCVGGCGPQ